jgi:hypothetical protein
LRVDEQGVRLPRLFDRPAEGAVAKG